MKLPQQFWDELPEKSDEDREIIARSNSGYIPEAIDAAKAEQKRSGILPLEAPILSENSRQAILMKEIKPFLESGFFAVSQTEYSAQLIRHKNIGCLSFFMFGLRSAPAEEAIHIFVDESGEVAIVESGRG
jgi:hypothetical protein